MLNTREKTIELLERSQTDFNSGREMRFVGGDVMPAVRRAIEKTEQNQKWIPVSERLPEENERVLGTKKGASAAFVFYGKRNNGNWVDLEWSCYRYGVTHWMPLPEPPKEDEG